MQELLKSARNMASYAIFAQRLSEYGFHLNESESKDLYQKYITRASVEKIIPPDQLMEITIMDFVISHS